MDARSVIPGGLHVCHSEYLFCSAVVELSAGSVCIAARLCSGFGFAFRVTPIIFPEYGGFAPFSPILWGFFPVPFLKTSGIPGFFSGSEPLVQNDGVLWG